MLGLPEFEPLRPKGNAAFCPWDRNVARCVIFQEQAHQNILNPDIAVSVYAPADDAACVMNPASLLLPFQKKMSENFTLLLILYKVRLVVMKATGVQCKYDVIFQDNVDMISRKIF